MVLVNIFILFTLSDTHWQENYKSEFQWIGCFHNKCANYATHILKFLCFFFNFLLYYIYKCVYTCLLDIEIWRHDTVSSRNNFLWFIEIHVSTLHKHFAFFFTLILLFFSIYFFLLCVDLFLLSVMFKYVLFICIGYYDFELRT